MSSRRLDLLRSIGRSVGSDDAAVDEVHRYGEPRFVDPVVPAPVLPQPDEPHVADWRRYAEECGGRPFEHLAERLPQLAIPVREGVSATAEYAAVTRRGEEVRSHELGGRLQLEDPSALRLVVHEHPAGALPVLGTPCRADFETLYRALACRNEPKPVSPSVNAQIVTGFVNWDRVRAHRRAWSQTVDPLQAQIGWPAEMARIAKTESWRYTDRILLTCDRPYSSVSAADLGLDLSEPEWRDRSTLLRIEHEFTHYATKRVWGSMSLNLHDETLADVMGVTLALGRYRADWYLRFLGLERWPEVRDTGRAGTYAGELSPAAFRLLGEVVVRAAQGVERIAERWYDPAARARFLVALAPLPLELLAGDEAEGEFEPSWERAGTLIG